MQETATPLGYLAAANAVRLGRAAFFGSADHDLPAARAPAVAAFDRVPQFGFTGADYQRHRVLLIGINPGNGPSDRLSAADAHMMPSWEAFALDPTPDRFGVAALAYQTVCRQWPLWDRHCSELLRSVSLTPEHIAYANCLPWRTASESQFGKGIGANAARLYAGPLISELAPRIVVALGVRAAVILKLLGPLPCAFVVLNRARALTEAVRLDRARTVDSLRRALG